MQYEQITLTRISDDLIAVTAFARHLGSEEGKPVFEKQVSEVTLDGIEITPSSGGGVTLEGLRSVSIEFTEFTEILDGHATSDRLRCVIETDRTRGADATIGLERL